MLIRQIHDYTINGYVMSDFSLPQWFNYYTPDSRLDFLDIYNQSNALPAPGTPVDGIVESFTPRNNGPNVNYLIKYVPGQ